MGVDPVSLALIGSTVISVGSKVASGFAAKKAANNEASLLEDQARIATDEAAQKAQIRATEVRKFAKTQKLAFLKNGVTLEGSPLLVLQDTFDQGQIEVNAITKQGFAQSKLLNAKAQIMRNQGRAALIGGFGDAASSLFSAASVGKTAGFF